MDTNEQLSNSGQQAATKPSENKSTQELKPSEPSEKKSNSRPKTEAEQLDAVTELLTGKKDQTQLGEGDAPDNSNSDGDLDRDTSQDQESQATKIELPETFSPSELAKALNITPKQLYERMQVTLKESGETVTFGEWKDRVQDQAHAARDHDKREEQILHREAQVVQNMQLIETVAQELGAHLPPSVMQEMQQRQHNKTQLEQQRMLNAMPELKDQAAFNAFKNDIVDAMSKYGFKPHELVISDHRILLALKDLIATKKRIKRLSEFDPERERKPKDRKPQKPQKPATQYQKKRGNIHSESDKVDAVASLISGGNR